MGTLGTVEPGADDRPQPTRRPSNASDTPVRTIDLPIYMTLLDAM
jgi:hypothetical protein